MGRLAAGARRRLRGRVLDGDRRRDLQATVAWISGVGLSVWAYYGPPAEVPKRIYRRMLRANFDYPFVKFALTDDDRPMLMTELPTTELDRDALALALVRLVVVADRLLDETVVAVAERGVLPDWFGHEPRNVALLAAHRAEAEATMPEWQPMPPARRRRSLLARLLGTGR